MTDKEIATGLAQAREAVNVMTLVINEVGEEIRKACDDTARKINEAMRVRAR